MEKFCGEAGQQKETGCDSTDELYDVADWSFAFSKSRPTLSSTPLINCTDSGVENLRATSSASLITTARGVPGNASSSATAARRMLRSTAAMRPMRQFSA